MTEGKTYRGNSWLNRSSYTITADAVTLCSCLWHLLPEKSLSLQEANKSQEYSDSCILNNNYPSVGIGTGVSVLPKKKKTVKNHIKMVMMRLVLYSSYEGLP